MRLCCIAVLTTTVATASAEETRSLRHEAIVEAPVAEVWEAFTTSEGIESWMVPHGEVDLRIGGAYKTNYENDDLDGPASIVNEIIAYEPGRMIAMRNIKAPALFRNTELLQQAWSVIDLEPLASGLTRVSVTGYGYGTGPKWDQLYKHFDTGNKWTLDQLNKKFDAESIDTDAAKVMERMRTLVGGFWFAEQTSATGETLRSAFTVREINDGSQLLAEGWLGDAETMKPHGLNVMFIDPATGLAWIDEHMEQGARINGPIWLEDETIVNGVVFGAPGRPEQDMRSEYRFETDDRYTWTLRQPDGTVLVELTFTRRPIKELGTIVEQKKMSSTERFADDPSPRAIIVEATIDAPPSEVYRVWTTGEGFRAVYDRDTHIEMRVGGPYEIYWDTENRIGSNGCTVLSFNPDEMLSFSWNAPPTIPEIRERRTVVTVTLRPESDGRTLMRIRNDGYGSGEAWDEAFAYFTDAWPWVTGKIVEHFGGEITLSSAE